MQLVFEMTFVLPPTRYHFITETYLFSFFFFSLSVGFPAGTVHVLFRGELELLKI